MSSTVRRDSNDLFAVLRRSSFRQRVRLGADAVAPVTAQS